MSDLQVITANYTSTSRDTVERFELPQNYSLLINKLERLALGLDSAFGNLSLDRKEVEVAVGASGEYSELLGGPLSAVHVPPLRATHPHREPDMPHVVSDIWIGVILTLLIVSVIFFICSCFLYHKFQQWKNSYRTTRNEPLEICRRFPPDYEVESLPSYTIVSGLPTYDDALEEFRKAGIILTPPMPVVKVFEKDTAAAANTKDNQIFNIENGVGGDCDNISVISTCTCGLASNGSASNSNTDGTTLLSIPSPHTSQVIELSPEQLAALSHKRLSLQIAFNNSVRRNSRYRGNDLYRQVNRNNLLRSQAAAAATTCEGSPQLHRSSSSLTLANEASMLDRRHLQQLQHRGSLY